LVTLILIWQVMTRMPVSTIAVLGESDIASKATRKIWVGSAACSTGTPWLSASTARNDPPAA
jgi:hypothetical protein